MLEFYEIRVIKNWLSFIIFSFFFSVVIDFDRTCTHAHNDWNNGLFLDFAHDVLLIYTSLNGGSVLRKWQLIAQVCLQLQILLISRCTMTGNDGEGNLSNFILLLASALLCSIAFCSSHCTLYLGRRNRNVIMCMCVVWFNKNQLLPRTIWYSSPRDILHHVLMPRWKISLIEWSHYMLSLSRRAITLVCGNGGGSYPRNLVLYIFFLSRFESCHKM